MGQRINLRHCPNPECPALSGIGRPAVYREEIEVCPDCRATLQVGPPDEAPAVPRTHYGPPVPVDEAMIQLSAFRDPVALARAAAILESEGIPCVVAGTQASVLYSGMLNQFLQVPESRAARASELLAEAGLDPGGSPEEWAAVRAHERAEHKRLGMHPLLYAVILFVIFAILAMLRILSRQ